MKRLDHFFRQSWLICIMRKALVKASKNGKAATHDDLREAFESHWPRRKARGRNCERVFERAMKPSWSNAVRPSSVMHQGKPKK